jgi:hypothetical protein
VSEKNELDVMPPSPGASICFGSTFVQNLGKY